MRNVVWLEFYFAISYEIEYFFISIAYFIFNNLFIPLFDFINLKNRMLSNHQNICFENNLFCIC